jgi:hypothetical protein
LRLDPGDGLGLCGLDVQPVQETGMVDPAGTRIGFLFHVERLRVLARGKHDRADRQAILAGELEVALIVRRAAEDGPGPVLHEHEISDPNREDLVGRERMNRSHTGVEAELLSRLQLGLGSTAGAGVGDEGCGVGPLGRKTLRQRMIRRNG